MDRVTEGLEYDGRAVPWIDFQEKINYLLEKLFDGEKKKLIEHFSDKTKLTPKYLISSGIIPEEIKEKFYERTTAYLDNHGYSMGATLFCMAEKRVIYPYSELMFHNYSSWARGKGGDMKTKMEHTDKHLTKFRHDMVVKQGFLTQEEFEQLLIGKDFWMDSQELCRRGIATHVMVNGEEIEADKYLEKLEK